MFIPYRFFIIASLVGSGKKVLDVGCGEGILAKMLQEKGNYVIGLDISEEAVKLARENEVKAFVCDVERDEFPFSDKFDVVILSEVLEHVLFPDKLLYKLREQLIDSESFFILSFPNMGFWRFRLALIKGRFPREPVYDFKEHLHYWTLPDFEDFLTKCNLKTLEISAVYSFPFPSVTDTRPVRNLLMKFPNLFGYQIVVKARPL